MTCPLSLILVITSRGTWRFDLPDGQTNRQADRQTDRQTDGRTLPKQCFFVFLFVLFLLVLVVLVVVLATFPLVVKVVAEPLLRLLRRKPPKTAPGPPKTRKTKPKNTTKTKQKHCLPISLSSGQFFQGKSPTIPYVNPY